MLIPSGLFCVCLVPCLGIWFSLDSYAVLSFRSCHALLAIDWLIVCSCVLVIRFWIASGSNGLGFSSRHCTFDTVQLALRAIFCCCCCLWTASKQLLPLLWSNSSYYIYSLLLLNYGRGNRRIVGLIDWCFEYISICVQYGVSYITWRFNMYVKSRWHHQTICRVRFSRQCQVNSRCVGRSSGDILYALATVTYAITVNNHLIVCIILCSLLIIALRLPLNAWPSEVS